MGMRLVAWVKACGDYYAAAALYEQLSALSDAELTRRGLSRATLARDVCAAYDCLTETPIGFTQRLLPRGADAGRASCEGRRINKSRE